MEEKWDIKSLHKDLLGVIREYILETSHSVRVGILDGDTRFFVRLCGTHTHRTDMVRQLREIAFLCK